MKRLITGFVWLLVYCSASGQDVDSLNQDSAEVLAPQVEIITEQPDEEAVEDEEEAPEPLFLPKDSLEKIRKQADYAYMANLDSLLRNLNEKKPEPKEDSGSSRSIFDFAFVKIIVWGLAILAVLYILYQLLAGQQNLFYKNKKLEDEGGSGLTDTSGLSPLVLLQQAVARGDYRLAVRYHFLYILQLMGEKGLVILQPQKSDAQYLAELRGKPPANDFSKITLQYEYVWYGEFELNAEQYRLIEGGYRKFIETWL